jgi:hypothetical protein
MLRFYRHSYEQFRQLEAKSDKDFDELREMDRLAKLLGDTPPDESFIQRLDSAWRGTLTTSGDAIWDDWVANVQAGHIPDSWWGGLKDGVRG